MLIFVNQLPYRYLSALIFTTSNKISLKLQGEQMKTGSEFHVGIVGLG